MNVKELSDAQLLNKYVLLVLETGAIMNQEKTEVKEEILKRMMHAGQ